MDILKSLKEQLVEDELNKGLRLNVAKIESRSKPLMLRQSPVFGFQSCQVLGLYVGETAKRMKYIDANTGKVRSIAKSKKTTYSMSRGQQVAHLEICHLCEESKHPKACMHGNVGYCDCCMSM